MLGRQSPTDAGHEGIPALDRVSFRFRKRLVLDSIDFAVAPGLTLLLGPNGAGKTTAFRLLVGQLAPSSGRVVGDPEHIALLPQNFDMVGSMRVEDTVAHAAWCAGSRSGDIPRLVEESLARVGLVDRRRDRVRALSGGMRQRLGIACVLTGSPQTLLLDEPTLGLDPVQRSRLRELLAELSQRMRIVVSTHAVDDIADIAQRIVVLGHRRVLYSGPVGELRTPGSSLEAAYVNLVTAS